MGEFKGTKGTWGYDIDESNSSIDLVLPNDTVISHSRHNRFTGEFVIERGEMNANMKLISKAPEMLKHLEMVIALEDLIVYPKDTKIEHSGEAQAIDEMLYLIKQLIKEATTL